MSGTATYGLAAACYAALLIWRICQPVRDSRLVLLLVAYLVTACWAWLSAIYGLYAPQTVLAGTLRYFAWLALLHRMVRQSAAEGRPHPGLNFVFGAQCMVLAIQAGLNALVLTGEVPIELLATFKQTSQLLRIVTASGALIIIHNLYGQAAPSSRGAIRMPMFALALMWGYDLNLFTFAYLGSPFAQQLFVWRGLLVAATVPMFAISDGRADGWHIRLSRAATFQSLSLLAICGYLAVMTITVSAVREGQWDNVELFAASSAALISLIAIMLLPSRARSWAKVKLAKHFFEHRYDYRSEWLRFTGTIGRSDADALPLGERVIKAFADIVDSPGGLLFVADESGSIDRAAAWNWPGRTIAAGERLDAPEFWRMVESEGRVIDLDANRRGWGAPQDRALPVPAWMIDDPAAWTGVPLIHRDRLIGIVLLAAPDYRRELDWEDFDLLRTAGRQAASSLAEAHGQEALLNAQRFEEFNRRFAFILHDVKNLVSQLSLLSRNAERHADNPEFRADMVATLKGSVAKMNDLLARLAPQAGPRSDRSEPTPLRDILSSAVAAKRRSHDVRLLGETSLWAVADAAGLEQAVGHLLQNAIDASLPEQSVVVRVGRSPAGGVSIAIVDSGAGMDSEFVRHRLFQPFASTKAGGFGVGAFEARSLIASMGGRLTVTSAPGSGSQFTIHLPGVPAEPLRKFA